MTILIDLEACISNLGHLFVSNKPPSESEKDEIQHILTIVKNDPTFIKEDDRCDLLDLVTKCNATLSCIRHVPPEVIARIFTMCVPKHIDDGQPWNTLDLNCAPWVLVQVSSLWRAVAIREPRLWAHIKIDLEEEARNGRPEPPLAMLETSLERSGSVPLRVFFHDSYQPTYRAQEFLASLMAHSHRWSQLSLFIAYPHLYLTNQVRGRLPLLQYLNIGAYGANTFPSFNGFEIAPMLHDVLIADEWEALTLPWGQITFLGGTTIMHPAPIIHQSTELLRCHISFPRGPFSGAFAPVTRHDRLTHMAVDAAVALRELILPSLQELFITGPAYPGDLRIFADFFQHSGSSLRVFVWRSANIRDPFIFKTLLQNTPNLIQLELSLINNRLPSAIQDCVIAPLIVTQAWRVLPRLESVGIQFDPNDPKPNSQDVVDSFLDMVESRWSGSSVQQDVTRLRKADITKVRSWDLNLPRTKERVHTLLEQGLLLTFKSDHEIM